MRAVRRFLLTGNLPPAERALVDRHVPPPLELAVPILDHVERDARTVEFMQRLNTGHS